MNGSFWQLIITLASLFLFLRIHWIQASSTSLMRLMRMKRRNVLNEIDLKNTDKIKRNDILETLSFLNLVAKMYLNSGININMLRTFEGVMIKVFEVDSIKSEYANVFHEFKNELNTAEPPYINLIYVVDLIKKSNKLLRRKSLFFMLYTRLYFFFKKINFKYYPGSKRNWKLAQSVFSNLPLDIGLPAK